MSNRPLSETNVLDYRGVETSTARLPRPSIFVWAWAGILGLVWLATLACLILGKGDGTSTGFRMLGLSLPYAVVIGLCYIGYGESKIRPRRAAAELWGWVLFALGTACAMVVPLCIAWVMLRRGADNVHAAINAWLPVSWLIEAGTVAAAYVVIFDLAAPVKQSLSHVRTVRRILLYLTLVLICAAAILPFLWMASASLKTTQQVAKIPPEWVPNPWRWRNYYDAVSSDKAHFALWTRNTLIVAVLSVLGTTLSSSLVAYGFAKIKFKGRGLLFVFMLSTMMIPFPVMMVSLFTIFRKIGDYTGFQMLGTLRPLWVGAWFGSAFNIFLLRQFYLTVPNELSEAARIDGCSEFGIYWRIILPLSRPALMVVALFTFMGTWRDFLGPLMYIQHPDQYTLALGLQSYVSQHGGTDLNVQMASAVLVIAPVIILFFMAQKTFIEGIATTGIKG